MHNQFLMLHYQKYNRLLELLCMASKKLLLHMNMSQVDRVLDMPLPLRGSYKLQDTVRIPRARIQDMENVCQWGNQDIWLN